jgi:hypothetical protein
MRTFFVIDILRGSCHLVLNMKKKLLLLFIILLRNNFGARSSLCDFNKIIAEQLVLLFDPAKKVINISKFDAHFKIRQPIQVT